MEVICLPVWQKLMRNSCIDLDSNGLQDIVIYIRVYYRTIMNLYYNAMPAKQPTRTRPKKSKRREGKRESKIVKNMTETPVELGPFFGYFY
jgi:hypothetical protein